MYENIRVQYPNFCIGPQTGAFCSVDLSAENARLVIKNSSGDLLDVYDFYPYDVLKSGSFLNVYPKYEFRSIKYVGPTGLASFYDNLRFYTLERYKEDIDSEYTSCVIRIWKVDVVNSRLVLYDTKTRDINAQAFVVENITTKLSSSIPSHTGSIDIDDVLNLDKNDVLMIGPSTDTSNPNAIEYVYVKSFNNTNVILGSYDLDKLPTQFEYVIGDPVTLIKDIYLFGNTDDSGRLYKLRALNYYELFDFSEDGIYRDVVAADWSKAYNNPSFVQETNLLTVDTSNYLVIKSQNLSNYKAPNLNTFSPIYDLATTNISIYTLQYETTKWSDSGAKSLTSWTSLNYVKDTILPYSNSVSIKTDNAYLKPNQTTIIQTTVRDQFGVTLINKNVVFYKSGDPGAIFNPPSATGVTDEFGRVFISYTSGFNYNGSTVISVRVDGGSLDRGSQYIWTNKEILTNYNISFDLITINQVLDKTFSLYLKQYLASDPFGLGITALPSIYIKCMSKFSNPGGHWTSTSAPDNYTSLLEQAYLPLLSPIANGVVIPPATYIGQYNGLYDANKVTPYCVTNQITNVSNNRFLDQMYISRHYSAGHTDDVNINQFAFVQEAIPPFWSYKNPVDTGIWLRLRPFAFSLNPLRFKIEIKEYSYRGKEEWRDITNEGNISIFDAGGSINGITFQWDPYNFFHHKGVVYTKVTVYDVAPVPNRLIIDYWFEIIADYKAPYLDNIYPEREAVNIPKDSKITFDLIDNGTGVNIDTLEVYVNFELTDYSYNKISDNKYNIYVDNNLFINNEEITVEVYVEDIAENGNKLLDAWDFYIVNSTKPWFDSNNFEPGMCKKGVYRYNRNISMQVYGMGDGVDVDSIEVTIGGRYRSMQITPIIYRVN